MATLRDSDGLYALSKDSDELKKLVAEVKREEGFAELIMYCTSMLPSGRSAIPGR